VVDLKQGFDRGHKYCGVFRFKFWRFGEWVEVCVDDRLPTADGNLIFLQSQGDSKNEFWPALFEKAYAKIRGCYGNLIGGQPIVAMRDFTGGITKTYKLKEMEKHPDLYETIGAALDQGALIGTNINNASGGEARLPSGLTGGHAYSLTGTKMMKGKKLVRIRNPHGYKGVEWNGAWSDAQLSFQVANKRANLPDMWNVATKAMVEENKEEVFNTVKNEGLVMFEDGCCMVTNQPHDEGFGAYFHNTFGERSSAGHK